MGDAAAAAARREARRRRILENSDSRLQRITGRQNAVLGEISSNISSETFSHTQSSTFHQSIPDTKSRLVPVAQMDCPDDFLASTNIDYIYQSNVVSENVEETNNSNLRNRFIRTTMGSQSQQSDSSSCLTPNEFVSKSDKQAPLIQESKKMSTLFSTLQSKWSIVLLALIVNVLYFLQLEYFCGKCIVLPFFFLILARLQLENGDSQSTGGNLISAALILSNINPSLIHKLRRFMKISSQIGNEFAIYIFSFVVMHNVFMLYSNNIDLTVSTID